MLRHTIYFEALKQIQDETSPAWTATAAGLVVLRLVDDWLTLGPQVVTTNKTGLGAVSKAVTAVSEGNQARALFTSIVDAIMHAEEANIGLIAPHLLSYGTTLVYDSRWMLAIDVFELVLAWTRESECHPTVALDAALYIASAYRNSGDAQRAAQGYSVLKHLAIQVGDESKRLTAEIGFAGLATDHGDLSTAEATLEEILRIAQRVGLQDSYTTALQARANVASKREQYDVALQYAYQALYLTKDPRNRDRLWHDIAVLFLKRGSWQVAQERFLVVAAIAQEQYVRLLATINLLDIAARTERRQDFDRYHQDLRAVAMPPYLRAEFYLALGNGYARFGNIDDARTALRFSIVVANEHQLRHTRLTAEKALAELS